MSRYLWLTWSAIIFYVSLNFLLQERTNMDSPSPVEVGVFPLPFKIWLAQRSDMYMFGALILPFFSAIALALLVLHLRGSQAHSHLNRLPAVIDRQKLGQQGRPTTTDRGLDRISRVAWPVFFIVITTGTSWHFVTGFFNHAVFTHSTASMFFESGWRSHLGHFNPFQTDLRYASPRGATYIAGLYPYFALAALTACTLLAVWWLLIWLPSPLWKRSLKKSQRR